MEKTKEIAEQGLEKTKELAGQGLDKAKDFTKDLDKNETVQEISAGILDPIYKLAENMAHPSFYWVSFAILAAGVVSFALQLVVTKLFLLLRFKFNLREILSDGLGLIVSLIGLVVVTQAATENSTFTQSSGSVVSAAAVGIIAGFIFYLWGQRTEFQAARNPIVVQPNDSGRR